MKTCSDAPVGYTDHPPVGEWQGWNGGDCPFHPLATVEYMMADWESHTEVAGDLDWSTHGDHWDIRKYRLIEEYKAPVEKNVREVYMRHDDSRGWVACHDECEGATLFREVLE